VTPDDPPEALVHPAMVLRIYVGEADQHGHEALYKHLVKLLRERGVWGATAFRGLMGYGAKSVLHAASPVRLSQDLPIVIEAVDRAEKIEAVVPEVCALVGEGLVTTQEVRVRKHAGAR
jgi:PII-like signaling protein